VVVVLKAMVTTTEGSAPGLVMQITDERSMDLMDKDLFKTVTAYKTTMAAFKVMLKNGLISASEYKDIDTKIAQKYGLSLSVIYR